MYSIVLHSDLLRQIYFDVHVYQLYGATLSLSIRSVLINLVRKCPPAQKQSITALCIAVGRMNVELLMY